MHCVSTLQQDVIVIRQHTVKVFRVTVCDKFDVQVTRLNSRYRVMFELTRHVSRLTLSGSLLLTTLRIIPPSSSCVRIKISLSDTLAFMKEDPPTALIFAPLRLFVKTYTTTMLSATNATTWLDLENTTCRTFGGTSYVSTREDPAQREFPDINERGRSSSTSRSGVGDANKDESGCSDRSDQAALDKAGDEPLETLRDVPDNDVLRVLREA